MVFFVSCITVSVIASKNTPESSRYFMILIISFMSSFKLSKVNSFPALTALFGLIFLLSLSNTFEVLFEAKVLTIPGKLPVAKGLARFK